MKPKWPKWVWILTAEDFKNKYIHKLRNQVFGKDSLADTVAYQYIIAEESLLRAEKALQCGAVWIGIWTDADFARIWNRAMKRLGYTEICYA